MQLSSNILGEGGGRLATMDSAAYMLPSSILAPLPCLVLVNTENRANSRPRYGWK